MIKYFLIPVAVSLVAATTASGQEGFRRGDSVIVAIPPSLFNVEIKRGNTLISRADYVSLNVPIEVQAGRVRIRGRSDWKIAGFPSSVVVKISNIRRTKDGGYADISGPQPLRITIIGDVDTALRTVLVRPSALDSLRDNVYHALAPLVFNDALADIPIASQLKLLRFADVVAKGAALHATMFKEKTYLTVDLRRDTIIYNDNKFSQTQRIAHMFNERLLDVIKAWAEPIAGVGSIHGLKLEFEVLHRDFVANSPVQSDELEVYLASEDIKRFAEADITSQQLIDASIVILNGNRINLPLAQ